MMAHAVVWQELEKGMDTMLRGYTEDGGAEDMQEATSRVAGAPSAPFPAARAKEEKKEKAKPRAARPSKRTRAAQRSAGDSYTQLHSALTGRSGVQEELHSAPLLAKLLVCCANYHCKTASHARATGAL